MEWKKTFIRGQYLLHFLFGGLFLLSLGAMIYALRLHRSQGEHNQVRPQMAALTQSLTSDQSFEKIAKKLARAESTKAADDMRALSQKIAQIEELFGLKVSEELALALRTFTKLIHSSSSISNPNDALKVLMAKIKSLNQLAQSRKWKTVEEISNRMLVRGEGLNSMNVASSVQISYLKSDLVKLGRVIEQSTLSPGDKAALDIRFTSMKNELELLGHLSSHVKDLKAHVTKASLALSEWMIEVQKLMNDFKGNDESKKNQLILFLASLVGIILLSWVGMGYLQRWQEGKMASQIEIQIKNAIHQGIMSDHRFVFEHFSPETKNEINLLMDEFKIKLNLGSMLHSGLPFAGVMVNTDFKLDWYNALFLEQFNFNDMELRSDSFSWEHLKSYLNLEEDPVYEAMVNKIAGIYPIKIKHDELAPALPYEMYVTPINFQKDERVMVFFYPLISVKEAIEEQIKLSKQLLEKLILHWEQGTLDSMAHESMIDTYRANDMEDIFTKVKDLHDKNKMYSMEAERSINHLENENMLLHQQENEWEKRDEERKGVLKQEFSLANDLRNSFLNSLEKSDSLYIIGKELLVTTDDLKSECVKKQALIGDLAKKLKDTKDNIVQFDQFKNDSKKLKFDLLEIKTKLISMNNHLFSQLPPFDDHQQKLANKYKDELAKLDYVVSSLEKKQTQLESLMTKMLMMFEKHSVEQMPFDLISTHKSQEFSLALTEIHKMLEQEEAKIIENFKCLHMLMKKDLSKMNRLPQVASEPLEHFLS